MCDLCPAGSSCAEGASFATACGAGTFAALSGSPECTKCPAGWYQDEEGTTTCISCKRSFFCKEGAAASLPCEEGSYSNATNLTRAADCTPTDPGNYSPTGSVEQMPCAAGTVAPTGRLGACEPCAPGSFQNATGATECRPCLDGYYCAKGSAAPLPCPGGTTKKVNVTMQSVDDCTTCGVGTFCPVGSSEANACSSGTFNDLEMQAECMKCAAGSFQDDEGATSCRACRPGHYCKEGLSAPLPCWGGRYFNESGATSVQKCRLVGPGWWAPLGSAVPIACPQSGFRCPGVQHDNVNDVKGSLPIEVKQGRMLDWRNITRYKFTLQLRLDISVDDWAEQKGTIEETLVRFYDSPVTLDVQAGSFILSATAMLNTSSMSASMESGAADSYARLKEELGFGVSFLSPLQVEEVVVRVPYDIVCRVGFYCSAAQEYPCPRDTWNNQTDQVDSKACVSCPLRSGTASVGTASADDCQCEPSYYRSVAGNCLVCPSGTSCLTAGITLETLPVRVGYFRLSNRSIDVRRCFDAAYGNASGCLAGGSEPCREGLAGAG